MKKTYNTAGRKALVDFLSAHPHEQFGAEALTCALYGADNGKKSSVYRQLTLLHEEGLLRKSRHQEDGSALYQYVGRKNDCDGHFHEQCLRCGRLEHLDGHLSAVLFEQLLKKDGFEVHCGRSVLFGLCASCRKEEANRA